MYAVPLMPPRLFSPARRRRDRHIEAQCAPFVAVYHASSAGFSVMRGAFSDVEDKALHSTRAMLLRVTFTPREAPRYAHIAGEQRAERRYTRRLD